MTGITESSAPRTQPDSSSRGPAPRLLRRLRNGISGVARLVRDALRPIPEPDYQSFQLLIERISQLPEPPEETLEAIVLLHTEPIDPATWPRTANTSTRVITIRPEDWEGHRSFEARPVASALQRSGSGGASATPGTPDRTPADLGSGSSAESAPLPPVSSRPDIQPPAGNVNEKEAA